MEITKRVVIIYGPPGSGKSTQAELFERKLDFFHFNTGGYIENVVHDPKNRNNAAIQKQKKLFDSGKLCDPPWVLGIIKEEAKRIASVGWNLVFSGSPRTMFETFGDKKNEGLFALLTKEYGKNVFFINLKIRESTSLYRNSHRQVCSVCGLPILGMYKKNKYCSFCMGKVYRRTLDTKEIIRVRLREYHERTYPILTKARAKRYNINNINGELPPYKVFDKIRKVLKI